MTIENLGVKLYTGTKSDRVSDSLGSDANGTNTGITLINGKEITWTSSGSTTTFNSVTKSASSAGWTNNYAHSQSYSSGIVIVEFDPNVGQGYGSLCGFDDGTNNSTPTDITLGMAGLTSASNCNTIVSGTSTDHGSNSWASGDIMKVEYNIGTGAYSFYRNGGTAFRTGTISSPPSSVRILVSSYSQNYKVTEIKLSGSGTSATANLYKLGTGAYSFDGTDDYVKISNDLDAMVSGDFSVAGWVYFDNADTGTTHETILRKGSGSTYASPYHDFFLYQYNTGVNLTVNDGSTYQTLTGTSGTSTVGWHHVCVTRASNVYTLYVDGTSNGTLSYTTTFGTQSWYFGCSENGTGTFERELYGKLDDWGCWARVLTATEISDLVNQTGYGDSIGSAGDGTNSNITVDTTNEKLGSGCYSFNDSSSRVAITPTGLVPANNYTISCWARINSSTDSGDSVWRMLIGSSWGVSLYYLASSTAWKVEWASAGSGNITTSAISQDTWYHVVLVNNGGTFTLYLNGVSQGTGSTSSVSSSTSITIGSDGTGNYFSGLIDDFGIWSRSLSTTEISALYNSGTGALITSLSDKSGLNAYYSMNTSSSANEAVSTLTGALVSSLSDKSNLKANYTMDSLSLGLTPTKETLDSTNGTTDWAEVGSRYTIDTSNNQIDFALVRDGSLYGTTTALYDLGASSMLNDTKFVLRYRLNFGTIDDPSRTPSVQFVFGAYSNTDGISISQDCITMFCAATSNTGNNWNFGVTDANGAYSQNPYVAFDASGTGVTGNNNWYVEMVRTSASAGVARLYSDSTYETLVQEKSLAFSSSNPQNLRYIGAKFFGSNTTATPTYNGYMSDVKIYNGVSSLDGCKNDFSATSALEALTGTRTNSIFQQTDDTPSYWWYNGTSWVLDGTTSPAISTTTSSDWTHQGTQGTYSTTSVVATGVQLVTTQSGSGYGGGTAVGDLGSALNDKWVMRFNFTTGSSFSTGGNAYYYMGLSSLGTYASDGGINDVGTSDAVYMLWHIADGNNRVRIYADGSSTNGTNQGSNAWSNNQVKYYELSYDGSTATLQRYTDSTYGTTSGSAMTASATATGLRYVNLGTERGTNMGAYTIIMNNVEIINGRTTWLE